MIAALPMYDWPELRAATDGWWAGLARHLRAAGVGDVPDALRRDLEPAAVWEHPGLLLAQTCGLPLVRRYGDRLRVVATPCYAAEGCIGPTYRSAIVVRADSRIASVAAAAGAVVAFNSTDSLSGHLALRLALADVPLVGALETGSHAASLEALHRRRADLCAVDCVSWAIARRHRPSLTEGVRVIGWSPPMPALPYVTRVDRPIQPLRAALAVACADPALAGARAALLLDGFAAADMDAYAVVLEADRTAPPLAIAASANSPS
mgnify:CR=1 FL=1